MTTVYTDKDFYDVYRQKNRIMNIFIGVTVFYIAFCIAWVTYYISLPYGDSMQILPKIMVYVASAIYIIFAFPFISIKYHRVKAYYKMMFYVSEGLKNVEENYFVTFEEKEIPRDSVDATACVFKTWSRKKSEWMEREAYFDNEKELPDFSEGDYVKYIVQGNFIIQYEIVEKQAILPDEEPVFPKEVEKKEEIIEEKLDNNNVNLEEAEKKETTEEKLDNDVVEENILEK